MCPELMGHTPIRFHLMRIRDVIMFQPLQPTMQTCDQYMRMAFTDTDTGIITTLKFQFQLPMQDIIDRFFTANCVPNHMLKHYRFKFSTRRKHVTFSSRITLQIPAWQFVDNSIDDMAFALEDRSAIVLAMLPLASRRHICDYIGITHMFQFLVDLSTSILDIDEFEPVVVVKNNANGDRVPSLLPSMDIVHPLMPVLE